MSEHELIETDDGGELLSTLPLSPKEELFCRAYADPESATYGRATKSAELAGYAEPHNAAWRLRRRLRIVARLAEFEKVTRVQIGKVLTDLEHERKAALEKGDIASAIRASELMGRHLAMFTDRVTVDESEESVARYERRREADLRIVEALVLSEGESGALPALPEAPKVTQEQAHQTDLVAEIEALEQGRTESE